MDEVDEQVPDLDEEAAGLLAAARAGRAGRGHVLRLDDLQVGQVGVVEAEVRAVSPVRRYARKRGGEGLLARVTLADASGEADLVLWDEEVRLAQDGPLQPGAAVRIHGPMVKAGRGGGGAGRGPDPAFELGLGSADIVPLPSAPASALEGTLTSIGVTRPVGTPPALRFTAELTLATAVGDVRVAAWDGAVKAALAQGVGARVRITGRPNPFLDGWWTANTLEPTTGPSGPSGPTGPAGLPQRNP